MRAVIMAGGFGTRMRPLTINVPKPMVLMVNRPMMEIIVDLLKRHQIHQMVSVVFYQPESITEYFRDGSPWNISMQYQAAESDLGTAGSVKNCQSMIQGERILVISGDVLTDFDLTAAIQFHQEHHALATMILTRVENPLAFGVVITDAQGRIEKFLEKPTWGEVFSDTVNTGIYILEPEVMDIIPAKTEFDFSKDLFPLMLKQKMPIYGYVAQGYWRDIGTLEQYRLSHQDIFSGKVDIAIPGLRLNKIGREIWMGENAGIDSTAQLSGTVVMGKNVKIGKNVRLVNSVLGDDCCVEEGASLINTILWSKVSIGAGVQARECVIATGTRVLEKANIFEGVIISDNCTIGKDVVLKAGVKVWPNKTLEDGSHLSTSLVWGDKWSRSLFGQYGVSGVAGIDMTPEFASKLGAAYGASLPRNSAVVTSRDIHKTSRLINRAMMSGILSAGVNVYDLREIPVSVARYVVPRLGAVGGLYTQKSSFDSKNVDMKFFDSNGMALSSGKEKGIENLFYREDFRRAQMEETGDLIYPHRVLEYYREGFLNSINVPAILEYKPKVVIDYAFSSASPIFPSLLGGLGCEVIALNAYLDATQLTKTPEAFQRSLQQLSGIVPTLKADFGVLFDAGAEKIFIVDEKGHVLLGEELQAFFCSFFFKTLPDWIVMVPVNSPEILEELALKHHGKIEWIRTNYYSLMESATRPKVSFVGDPSGGCIFPQFAPFMDAMMSTAKVMEILSVSKQPLSSFIDHLPKRIQMTQDVPCSWEMKGTIMRCLIEDTVGQSRDLIDGIKLKKNKSVLMILPDSDKALFHITATSDNRKEAEELISTYVNKIKFLQK